MIFIFIVKIIENDVIFQQPEVKSEEVETVKMEMDTNDDEDYCNDHEEEKLDDKSISIKDELNLKDNDNKESSPIKEEDSKDFDSPEKPPSQKSLQVID